MTELLHQTDTYLREFDATVTAVTDRGVVLDRTAFYPGGGGQPPDRGVLEVVGGVEEAPGEEVSGEGEADDRGRSRAYRVTGLRRIEGETVHLLEGEDRPAAGDGVHGVLDWERRYLLMRTHTAMHILCGVVWRDHRASVTGGNMEPGRGRLDFELERLERELVDEIEAKINAEVEAARPLHVRILPREEAFRIPDLIRTKINLLPEHIREVRTVEIEGLDLQADGGTHVANTREVGPLVIADYKSKGRNNKRIVVELKHGT